MLKPREIIDSLLDHPVIPYMYNKLESTYSKVNRTFRMSSADMACVLIELRSYNRLLGFKLNIGMFVPSLKGHPIEVDQKDRLLIAEAPEYNKDNLRDSEGDVIFKGFVYQGTSNGAYVLTQSGNELRFSGKNTWFNGVQCVTLRDLAELTKQYPLQLKG